MFFNSYSFVLLFLPIAVCGYFLCNKRNALWGKCFLLAVSLLFYGLFDWRYLPVLCGSILFNYLLAAGMRRAAGKRKKPIFAAGLAVNILLLVFFKYTNFFLKNWNALTGSSIASLNLILPVGISFFTFQQIAFLSDSCHDESLAYSLLDYALYASFFPYIISGPIALHSQMIPQFGDPARKQFDAESFAKGLCSFSFGLAKKVLLADTLAAGADWAFSHVAALNAPEAWLGMLTYTLQIYFDFSGYSDMARGIGLMLRLDIPVNFNSPYRALSVTDFWKRWHITLTSFFTRYVYIPLGGNRKGTARTYLNVMLIFLLSGFWHGANWTFLVWGLLHGLGSVACRALHGKVKLPKAVKWLLTFLFINITWVVFRADSLMDALRLFKRLLLGGAGGVSPEFTSLFLFQPVEAIVNVLHLPVAQIAPVLMGGLLLFGTIASIFLKNTQERVESSPYGGKLSAACAVLLVWSVLSFSGVTSFIYVNF